MKQIFIILTALLLFSCAKENKKFISLRGEALGTTYSIKYQDLKECNFSKKISELTDITNHSISTYIKNSAISKINQGDSLVKIDTIFEKVFIKAKKIHQETDGFFDPTVGNLVNAWGFGAKKTPKNIDSLMQFVGFDKVQLSANVRKKWYSELYDRSWRGNKSERRQCSSKTLENRHSKSSYKRKKQV